MASFTGCLPRCSASSGSGSEPIAVAPVGCSVFAYDYLAIDFVEAPHGRAPAVATGVRRVLPDAFVLTYQGDGDLAAIGTAEIVHAAARGELITADLRQQRHLWHDRRPDGADHADRPAHHVVAGRARYPRDRRSAAHHRDARPVARCGLRRPHIGRRRRWRRARRRAAIKRACQIQLDGAGFALVEVLSNCPIGWGMTPVESMAWLKDHVVPVYPLGVIVDRTAPVTKPATAEH